jgi:hypothetical protein
MIAIRISKAQRTEAWRAMIEVAPVRLVSKGPVYEVYPAHLELLTARGIPYELVSSFWRTLARTKPSTQ